MNPFFFALMASYQSRAVVQFCSFAESRVSTLAHLAH